jgi:hypothetical protein
MDWFTDPGRPAGNAAGAGGARALQRGPHRLPHKWKQMREWRRRGWGMGRPPGPRRGCAGHCAAATGPPAANATGAEGVRALLRGRAGSATNGSKCPTQLARGCAAGARSLGRCVDGQPALCAGVMHTCFMRTCARRARVACACSLLRVPFLCVPALALRVPAACTPAAPSCWACACAAVVSIMCTLLVNVVDIAGQSSRSCALRSSPSSTSRGVRLDRAAFARHRRRHHGVHVCARLHSHVLN